MSDRDAIYLCLTLLCAALSFLFSGMEAGVLALNHPRLRQRMRTGDKRARVLHGFTERPENFLWTILVGNTVVNFFLFSLAVVRLRQWLHGHPWWQILSFAALVFLFYIVCELLPKTLFQRTPNRLTLTLARPFRLIHRVLAPLVAVAAWFARGLLRLSGGQTFQGRLFGSREELRFVVQESAANLSSEEKAMIGRVLDLQNLRVRHIAVPMGAATRFDTGTKMSEVLAECAKRNYSRAPVLDGKTGRVAGVINLEHMLFLPDLDRTRPAGDYMEPAFFLPEEMRLEIALRQMQAAGKRMAVAFSPDHGETGLLSLQDILKVIFGEMPF